MSNWPDRWSNLRLDLECGMVSEETSEQASNNHLTTAGGPHETPYSTPLSVSEFFAAHQEHGRAVLSYTNYRNDHEPLVWIVRIRNKFRMVSYWVCHHSKLEIRQVSADADVCRLGVPVTVLRRAD